MGDSYQKSATSGKHSEPPLSDSKLNNRSERNKNLNQSSNSLKSNKKGTWFVNTIAYTLLGFSGAISVGFPLFLIQRSLVGGKAICVHFMSFHLVFKNRRIYDQSTSYTHDNSHTFHYIGSIMHISQSLPFNHITTIWP